MNRLFAYNIIKFARFLAQCKCEEIALSQKYQEYKKGTNTLHPKQVARFYVLKVFNLVVSYFCVSYLLHWFFWVLLISMLVFIKIQAKDTQAILRQIEQMPMIELYDFSIYDLNNDYIKANLQGQKALRFAEYEVGYESIMSIKSDKKSKDIEYIYGEELRKEKDEYIFNKGGVYAKQSGESFWSEKGIYDIKKGIFKGDGEFWVVSLEGSSTGENILYKQKEGIMQAQNVKAKIYLANKSHNTNKAHNENPPSNANQHTFSEVENSGE